LQRNDATLLGALTPVFQLFDQLFRGSGGSAPEDSQFLAHRVDSPQHSAGTEHAIQRCALVFRQRLRIPLQQLLDCIRRAKALQPRMRASLQIANFVRGGVLQISRELARTS
jgi:hypothetical protein